MLRGETIKFIKGKAINHLYKFNEKEQHSNLFDGDSSDDDFEVQKYYPTQRPLNRFQLPDLSTPTPYKQAQGMPMPRTEIHVGY